MQRFRYAICGVVVVAMMLGDVVYLESRIRARQQLETAADAEANIARRLNTRGIQLSAQGNFGEAIPLFEEAVEVFRRLIKQKDFTSVEIDLANTINNLGIALRHQGKFDKSIRALTQAIGISAGLYQQKATPDVAKALANSHNNRGICFSEQGQLNESIADFGRSIALCTQLIFGASTMLGSLPFSQLPGLHPDMSFAQRVHDTLRAKGIRCWLDAKQVRSGDSSVDNIRAWHIHLDSATIYIFFCHVKNR